MGQERLRRHRASEEAGAEPAGSEVRSEGPGNRQVLARLQEGVSAYEQALLLGAVQPESSNRERLGAMRQARGEVRGAPELPQALGGEALPPAVQQRMEAAFGHDFSHVRVHVGGDAARAADDLSAAAFALGSHLWFGQGQFAPGTPAGDRLLAHELTHVVQHDQGRLQDHGRSVSVPSDPEEIEAERTASRFMSGLALQPTHAGSPHVMRQSTGHLAAGHLLLEIDFRGESVRYDLQLQPLDHERFVADEALVQRLALQLERLFTPGQPVWESAAFLSSGALSRRLWADLEGWLRSGGLPQVSALLDERARTLQGLRLLEPLERHLAPQGYAPGSLDWVPVLHALQARPVPEPGDAVAASIADRYATFLRALSVEAGRRPSVTAPAAPDLGALDPILRSYCDALPHDSFGEAVDTHSQAFLARWVTELASVQVVPEGFDLERFRPATTAADVNAVRDEVFREYEQTRMTGVVTLYLLDHWSVTGQNEEGYLRALDLEALRAEIYERLVDDFLARARQDARYQRAIADAVQEQGRYDAIRALHFAGTALQTHNRAMPMRLASTPLSELSGEEQALAADPRAYVQDNRAISGAIFQTLSRLQSGSSLEQAAEGVQLPGEARWASAVSLVTGIARMRALRELVGSQREGTRRLVQSRLDLSWELVSSTVRRRWQVADEFIRTQYVPALTRIALRHVEANRAQLQQWLDNWDTRTPALASQYRVSAMTFEHIAGRLERGEADSVELDGEVLGQTDAFRLRHMATTFRGLAERLSDPRQAARKRAELQEAVQGFAHVAENIRNGNYKPYEWGRTISREARAELGIGSFPEGTTVGQAISGEVSARENPFLARAIEFWRWSERTEATYRTLVLFTAAGLLTLSSMVVPGAAGLVLGALDAMVGMYGAVEGVRDARRTLELSLLDPGLQLQGVTVEQARSAMNFAWIGAALAIVLPLGAGALMARLAWRGRQAGRAASQLVHFSQALAEHPGSVEHLLGIVRDPVRLNELIGRAGNVRRLEGLFLHCDDAVQVDQLLGTVRDPARLLVWVERSSGATVSRALQRVTDAAAFESLAATYSDDIARLHAHLAPLGADASAQGRLLDLLRRSGGLPGLDALLVRGGDTARVATMLDRADAPTLQGLLDTVQNGAHVETLLRRCDSPAQINALLAAIPDGASLVAHVQSAGGGRALTDIVRRVPNVAVMDELSTAFGGNLARVGDHLAALGDDAGAAAQLQDLLRRTGSSTELERLITASGGDIRRVRTLLGDATDASTLSSRLARLDGLPPELAARLRAMDTERMALFLQIDSDDLFRTLVSEPRRFDFLFARTPAQFRALVEVAGTDLAKFERFARLADYDARFASHTASELRDFASLTDDAFSGLLTLPPPAFARFRTLPPASLARFGEVGHAAPAELANLARQDLARFVDVPRDGLSRYGRLPPAELDKFGQLDAVAVQRFGSLPDDAAFARYAPLTQDQLRGLGLFDDAALMRLHRAVRVDARLAMLGDLGFAEPALMPRLSALDEDGLFRLTRLARPELEGLARAATDAPMLQRIASLDQDALARLSALPAPEIGNLGRLQPDALRQLGLLEPAQLRAYAQLPADQLDKFAGLSHAGLRLHVEQSDFATTAANATRERIFLDATESPAQLAALRARVAGIDTPITDPGTGAVTTHQSHSAQDHGVQTTVPDPATGRSASHQRLIDGSTPSRPTPTAPPNMQGAFTSDAHHADSYDHFAGRLQTYISNKMTTLGTGPVGGMWPTRVEFKGTPGTPSAINGGAYTLPGAGWSYVLEDGRLVERQVNRVVAFWRPKTLAEGGRFDTVSQRWPVGSTPTVADYILITMYPVP